jgi:hypothetical protein
VLAVCLFGEGLGVVGRDHWGCVCCIGLHHTGRETYRHMMDRLSVVGGGAGGGPHERGNVDVARQRGSSVYARR